MKRRKFLGLFSGAIAAPFIPVPAMAAAPAAYSKTALHGAIMLAQTRGSFSVWGLSNAVQVPVAQAEAIMGDLAKRGILGPLEGTTYGGRWAKSKVLLSEHLASVKAMRSRSTADRSVSGGSADLSDMMAHLRAVAERYFAAQKNTQVQA